MDEQMAQDTDPVATVVWTPPLYPDTVEMQTGHTREAELAQLQAELQTALRDKADVEIERDVTVLNLAEMRRLFRCANKAKREALALIRAYADLPLKPSVFKLEWDIWLRAQRMKRKVLK